MAGVMPLSFDPQRLGEEADRMRDLYDVQLARVATMLGIDPDVARRRVERYWEGDLAAASDVELRLWGVQQGWL